MNLAFSFISFSQSYYYRKRLGYKSLKDKFIIIFEATF